MEAGCACGLVRIKVSGAPLRAGLCHCLTCRKYHGSAFNAFVVFPLDAVVIEGPRTDWRSSDHAIRVRCSGCGSPVAMIEDRTSEIELNLGSFDDSSLFTPAYEHWIVYRERWLTPTPGKQNARDRQAEENSHGEKT